MACMKGKNKRKHTNGFNENRLMLISWAAPVLAQLVMLVVMIAQRQWLYVAMLAPGLIGSAMSLVSMTLRSRQKQQYDEPADATPAKVAETLERTIDRPSFAAMPRVCFEHLYGLNDDMLPWRTIARTWLSPTSSCLLGITQHGLFRTDLQRSGPHAMVAGTTGSGKSELLISWCLSLAMQYSPDDLHFVFLDFKGGSTFNALEQLPHTVGNVCDLDLSHAVRALNAIEQELIRREALVSSERVSRFDQLANPPARLVVVPRASRPSARLYATVEPSCIARPFPWHAFDCLHAKSHGPSPCRYEGQHVAKHMFKGYGPDAVERIDRHT